MTKSTITRERLELIANFHRAMVLPPSHDEIEELARMALLAMDSEPVAWRYRTTDINGKPNPHWSFSEEASLLGLYQPLYAHPAQPAPASPVCTCPSGDGSLRWPCQVHPGNSPVIPDGSASMLRRWLAFGRGMQNAGSQLPHNLIAETEAMLAAAPLLPGSEPAAVPGKWIPVSERMPEREVDVQVYCPDKKEQMVAYLERNELEGYFRFATWRTGEGIYCQPTHWMPLPAAPQEGK
ncbi:TPA: DUF551 domain-containing protein [Klebsiella pneumoniae]